VVKKIKTLFTTEVTECTEGVIKNKNRSLSAFSKVLLCVARSASVFSVVQNDFVGGALCSAGSV